MKCYYHREQDAAGTCSECGKAACHDCLEDVGRAMLCTGCIHIAVAEMEEERVMSNPEEATSLPWKPARPPGLDPVESEVILMQTEPRFRSAIDALDNVSRAVLVAFVRDSLLSLDSLGGEAGARELLSQVATRELQQQGFDVEAALQDFLQSRGEELFALAGQIVQHYRESDREGGNLPGSCLSGSGSFQGAPAQPQPAPSNPHPIHPRSYPACSAMKCFYHREMDAAGTCSQCGKAACHDCLEDVGRAMLCTGCIDIAVAEVEHEQTEQVKSAQRRLAFSFLFVLLGVGLSTDGYFDGAHLFAAFFVSYVFWSLYWAIPAVWRWLGKVAGRLGVVLIIFPPAWPFLFVAAYLYGFLGGGFWEYYKCKRLASSEVVPS